jgi:hypothetical protein
MDLSRLPANLRTPSGLTAYLRSLNDSDKATLDEELRAAKLPIWYPQVGPQTAAYNSDADYTFFGGAAGASKTDLLIGTALTQHSRAIIFRRQFNELNEIIERTEEVTGGRRGFNGQLMRWRFPTDRCRILDFGAAKHAGDEKKYLGWAHDLKAFDEVVTFTEAQFRFLCGWMRTTDPNQRCRVIAASNPPTDADGAWVIQFWAPWLDKDHPNPAKDGELRWFITVGSKDEELPGPGVYERNGETYTAKSRTAIRGTVEDNVYYITTGYREVLEALPEPLRSIYLHGDFTAGRGDDVWQVIPTAWIKAAQKRWTPEAPDIAMLSLGVDVARGGDDRTVLTPRRGWWFGEQQVYPGQDTPNGPLVAALIAEAVEDGTVANIDVLGPGGSVVDSMPESIPFAALNSAGKSRARDKATGRLGFFNKRAEWWWRLREALDPDNGEGYAIPPDRELRAELASARWKLTARGIQIQEKEEIIKRLGRSPDKAESVIYAAADSHMTGLTEEHFATGRPLDSAAPDWGVASNPNRFDDMDPW